MRKFLIWLTFKSFFSQYWKHLVHKVSSCMLCMPMFFGFCKNQIKWHSLTRRYLRVSPKYGQALREAHETLHPAGISLFGLIAWGSNLHKCLRLQCFFFSYASYDTIFVRWSSLSAEGKMYVTETRSSVKLKKKSAWSKWLLLIDIYTKLKSLKLSPFVVYNQRLNIQKNAEASWDKPHLLEFRKKGKKYFQHCFIAILRLQHTNLMLV